jgi:hypothetical protein
VLIFKPISWNVPVSVFLMTTPCVASPLTVSPMPGDTGSTTVLVEWLGAHALPLYGAILIALLVSATAAWALARRYTVPTDTSQLPPGAYWLIRLVIGFAIVVGAALLFAEAAEVLGSSADARRAGELDQVFSNAVRRGIGPAAFQFFFKVTHLADTATLAVLVTAGALALIWLHRRWLALAGAGLRGGCRG